MTPARVRVVGCGNPDAGDDAVGLLAVRRAREMLEAIPGVEVVEVASPLRIIELLAGATAVVIVDAVRAPRRDRAPGTIVRVEAGPGRPAAEIDPSLSSHGFGVAEALGLAATLGEIPRVVLVGIEVADVTAGHALSVPVGSALPDLVARVVGEAEGLAST